MRPLCEPLALLLPWREAIREPRHQSELEFKHIEQTIRTEDTDGRIGKEVYRRPSAFWLSAEDISETDMVRKLRMSARGTDSDGRQLRRLSTSVLEARWQFYVIVWNEPIAWGYNT